MVVASALFGFSSMALAAPANDDFANAAQLTGPPGNVSGSNVDATKETGEPDHAGDAAGHSVWWRWTAAETAPVALDTCDSQVDTVLAVYTGSSVGALTEVGSNNTRPGLEDVGCDGVKVRFKAVAGHVYNIAVDSKTGGTPGNIALRLARRPDNDDFADAAVVSGLATVVEGNNEGATSEPGEPNHFGSDSAGIIERRSVWWSWTAPETGRFELDTCGSDFGGFQPVVAVYTGTKVDQLTLVGKHVQSQYGCGPSEYLVLNAVAGTTYRIAVAGSYGSAGPIELGLFGPPDNDNFGSGFALAGSSLFAEGDNFGATKEPGEPNHAGNAGGHSVWWQWTAPANGNLLVDTCDSDFDTLLGAYTGGSVGGLVRVASNDDSSSECGLGSQVKSLVTFDVVRGQTYRIAVDGKDGRRGDIVLFVDFVQPPVNTTPGHPTTPPPPATSRPHGTSGNDVLLGTAGDDLLCGLGGADTIRGLAGNDTLFGDQCGVAATNRYRRARMAAATDGNDRLNGGPGNDKLYGSGGADLLVGGPGRDRLFGGRGNDRLSGGSGNDRLSGSSGNDRLSGSSGKDILNGGKGRDRISAGAGNDSINSRDGKRDRVDCGTGRRDKIKADRRDRLRRCERVRR